jgi:hypothetical protein
MHFRRRAVALLLSLGFAVQVAYPAPLVPADGGQVQTESVPAILRIRVLEGEGSIHTSGTRSSQAIIVLLSDESGRQVEGASVSVRLPEEGPTGVFANGMRTEIALTGVDGRVTIRGIQWARDTGPVQIRITAIKGEARAGILSTQYITERSGGQRRSGPEPAAGAAKPPVRLDQPSRSKWVLLAVLIGGAAAGGVAAAAKGGRSKNGSQSSAPTAVTQPSATIGNPTITIGRP